MNREYRRSLQQLAIIAYIRDITHSLAFNWVRTKLLFAFLKKYLLCLRGSRNKNVSTVEGDIKISTKTSRILQN